MLGSIKDKLHKRVEGWKETRRENQQFNAELRKKEKAAFNEAYMKSRMATARVRGAEAGKRGGGGTLGKAWKITQGIGEGFIKTAEEMYPEYAGKRTPHRTVKRKKKSKRDPLDLLGW